MLVRMITSICYAKASLCQAKCSKKASKYVKANMNFTFRKSQKYFPYVSKIFPATTKFSMFSLPGKKVRTTFLVFHEKSYLPPYFYILVFR